MAKFSNARRVAEQAAARQTALRAQELRTIIISKFAPGRGETYELYKPRRTHTASAPGDAPAVDTGRLRGSIAANQLAPYRWRVGTNVKYAAFLEFGTRRIAPRPFMRPSLEELQQRFRR